jgi:nucleoside 2-deoxyribosyltransferase
VEFSDLQVIRYKPKAFVIMKFGEPFDSLYSAVIKPDSDSEKAVFDMHRADETLGPGSIPEDIVRNLIDADLVIAEISSTRKHGFNANVFYELGYAHSLSKPTILLVREGTQLPFDIRHHRVIFYEDSPDGRLKLKNELQKHLEASVASSS